MHTMTPDGWTGESSDHGAPTWEHLVERQRRENEGLRAALRYRAVIEQAKGVLMARSGSDPERAFRQLVAHSQRTNLKLTQVAAAVVSRTITTPPIGGPIPSDGQLLEAATSDVAAGHLTAAAVVSAPDLEELLRTVMQHTEHLGVVAGTLALAEPDGALRLAGVHGTDERAVSGWKRIPPGTDLPLCAAAANRSAVWLVDRAERLRRFPAARHFPAHRDASAVLPLLVGRQLVGVIAFDFAAPQVFDESMRDRLLAVADLCSAPVADLLRRYDEPLPGIDFEPGYAGWFRGFLDSLPTPAAILEPEFDGTALVDLEVLFVNRRARRADVGLRTGRSLLEMRPELMHRGLLGRAEAAFETPSGADEAMRGVDDIELYQVGSLLAMTWGRPGA